MKDKLLEDLRDIFSTVLDQKDIKLSLSDTPKTIENWDSLTHSRLLVAIEDEFQISFKLKELATMKSVEDIMTAVQSKISHLE